MSEIEKQILLQKLQEKLTPLEREKLKTQPKKQYYTPPALRGFKLRYAVGELSILTEVKIKALTVPKDTSIYEKNKVTGNKVKLRTVDKSTGKRLPNGYGFAKYDEVTDQPVQDNEIVKVQLKPDANSPTGFKEVEVSSFSRTDSVDITDSEILPRQVLNDWIVDYEYEIFGSGSELFKIVESLSKRNSVAGIKEFNLTESNLSYKGFLVPPPILTENKFYFLLKLVRKKRESLITSWLNKNDISITEKKTKTKTGQKIDTNTEEF